jgi:RND family efflux transporter MFP subunit
MEVPSMNAMTVVALACCVAAPAQKPDPRPNILVIVADDWSWPHAGCLGDKVVKTPNFDKLVKKGMLFRKVHCGSPSCTPSRGAILTGQAIQRLQQGANLWSNLPQQYQCYPDILAASGYVIGLIGKGWGPGSLEDTGRDHNPAGPTKHKTFAAFLKSVPKDRPFCFWYGSRDPHRPYDLGSGVKAGLKPENVVVPPYWPDTPAVRGDICDYYEYVQRFDQQLGELLQALEEAGLAENTIIIVTSDNGWPFPRCKANLYEGGTHMPMAIAWAGRVKAGSECDAFISQTDLAPTILEAAGLKVPKEMTGKSFLKILKGEDKGADRDKVFFGRERHANVRKGDLSYPARAVRTDKFLYIKNFRPERWPAGDPELYFAVGPFGDIDDGPCKRAVMALQKGKLWELSLAKRPAEELFDLAKDPWEMTNVADDPKYKEVRAAMRAELERYMKETEDPRAAPGGGDDRWDKFKYYGTPAKKEKARLLADLDVWLTAAQERDGPGKAGFQTLPVKRGNLAGTVRAGGVLMPEETVEVAGMVSGVIQILGPDPRDAKKTIDIGTPVEEGSLLCQLDPGLFKIRVEQEKAKLELARAELLVNETRLTQAEKDMQRAKELAAQKLLPQAEYDRQIGAHQIAKANLAVAKANAALAEANLKEAETHLSYTTIKSPIKGIVIDRRVNVGQTVSPGLNAQGLFLIARDLKKMEVWVTVPEGDVGLVKAGQEATFTVAAYPGKTFTSKVSGPPGPRAFTGKEGVTFLVAVSVDNADGKLLPDMTADVRIEVGARKDVLLVPSAALRWLPRAEQIAPDAREDILRAGRHQDCVWVEDKGLVRPIFVQRGLSDGALTEIVKGDLKEGMQLVVGGGGKEAGR